jgi:glutamate racemase
MLAQALQLTSSLNRPLGVFDSGVGGLTVLKALKAALPQQDFIYLGDTARLPYGRKPPQMVAEFARGITRFLLECGVQGVVIACNTASSVVLPALEGEIDVPVWGVIEPGVEAARRSTKSGQVGVIGTKGTILSKAYQSRLEKLGLTAWGQACPLFVPLVEEGLFDSSEAEMLAHFYLDSRPNMDTLILGCTHYPVLRPMLERVLGDAVRLVDSAEVTAEQVRAALEPAPLSDKPGRILHFVTGDPLAYTHTAGVIGGVEGDIHALEGNILSGFERSHLQQTLSQEAIHG